MTWTRLEYATAVRAAADATGAARWGSSVESTEVLDALSMVHAREWKKLLNVNRYLRLSSRSVTTDSSGRVTIASLNSPNPLTGDSQERFYRLVALLGNSGATKYERAEFAQLPTAVATGAAQGVNTSKLYYRAGNYLQVLPVQATLALTAWVNHIPTPIGELSASGVTAEFPEDYELIIAYEAAAALLMKGSVEISAAAGLQQLAEQLRQEMHGDLGRDDTEPQFMGYTDRREEWDG